MALEKITEAQMDAKGVCAAPDILNGTPAQNKSIFDRMVRQLIAPAYNACVDLVNTLEMAEDTRQAAEALRVSAEDLRAAAETARDNAESGRITAEEARAEAERLRVSAEQLRADAEALRIQAEEERISNETARKQSEKTRAEAEESRQAAENTRKSNETARKNAEIDREDAETGRSSAEGQRASAEASRVTAEKGRVTAEQEREDKESSRQTAELWRLEAEAERVAAEQARADENAGIVAQATEKASAAASSAASAASSEKAAGEAADSAYADRLEAQYIARVLQHGQLPTDLPTNLILEAGKAVTYSATDTEPYTVPTVAKSLELGRRYQVLISGAVYAEFLWTGKTVYVGRNEAAGTYLVSVSGEMAYDQTTYKLTLQNGTMGFAPNSGRSVTVTLKAVDDSALPPSRGIELDNTLTKEGKAADAAVVGARLDSLSEEIANLPSGGGGTTDYTALSNKPQINGVELSGDKTSEDLGIGNPTDVQVASAVETWLDAHPEATTTVEDGSITEAKLADGAVSAQKAGFLEFSGNSENLFDKSECVDNENVDKSYGSFSYADGICRSAYIPVTPGTVYIRNYGSYLNDSGAEKWMNTCFYDSDKRFISGVNHYKATAFTTPSNAAYLVMGLYMAAKDSAMLVKGDTVPSEYVPYREYYKLGDAITISVDNIESLSAIFEAMPDGSITEAKLADEVTDEIESVDSRVNNAAGWNDVRQTTKKLAGRINVFEHTVKGVFDIASDIHDKTIVVHGVNYFDKNDLVPGKINTNGTVSDSATEYYTSRLIPVQPGKKLYCTRNTEDGVRSYVTFWLYGANQEYLRYDSWGNNNIHPKILTTGDDVYYIRVSCGNLIDADAEKLCIADVDIGNPVYGGYDGNSSIESGGTTYFGKNVYFPYVGYRIENGVLVGASDTYTVEEITHVDVFDSAATIEVTVPVEGFDQKRLQNVTLEYGRSNGSDYVMARIFKNTITGDTITPKVLAFTPGGKTMAVLTKENDFVMAINAGVFDMTDSSCVGNTISGGTVVTDHVANETFGSSDTLAIDSSGNLLSYPYETTTADMLNAGVQHAVQGKGTLITDFGIVDMGEYSEKLGSTANAEEKHPRTVIGQYKNGDYMVFTCGGRETNQAGMTMHEINELLVGAGVKYAYNLDGGGSCYMRYFKKELAPYSENRSCPSYIVFA